MNFVNFSVVKEPAPSTDWRIFGNITDSDNNLIGTYGVDGTSLFTWWLQQSEEVQRGFVLQMSYIIAQEIVGSN
jgi:hypothetical protein